MYNFLSKNGQTVSFLLGLVIVLIYLVNVATGLSAFDAESPDQQFQSNIFNFGLSSSLVLMVLCAVAALLFGIYHLVTNPKGSMKFLLALGVILVIYFISYSMADSDMSGAISAVVTDPENHVTAHISKMISAALSTSIVLAVLAIVSFVGFEIINLFK